MPRQTLVSTALILTLLISTGTPALAAPVVSDLGLLPGGTYLRPRGISLDGSIISGDADTNNGTRVFRWTDQTGVQLIDTIPNQNNYGFQGMSGSGNVITGNIGANGGGLPFIWSNTAGTREATQVIDPGVTTAYAVNGDGAILAGSIGSSAFRWTTGGPVEAIPDPSGTVANFAPISMSSDGNTVLRQAFVTGAIIRSFVWTAGAGYQAIPSTFPAGRSIARRLSADGSTAVGFVDDNLLATNDSLAFRWTAAGGVHTLGLIPGFAESIALGVNADGSTIVGRGLNGLSSSHAFLWTQALGIVDLNTYLPSQGADLSGWMLTSAYAVSGDGTVITGEGLFNGQARGFVVTIPAPGPATGLALAGLLAAKRRRR